MPATSDIGVTFRNASEIPRNYGRFTQSPILHKDMEQFGLLDRIEEGVHSVSCDDKVFDFLYKPAQSQTLVVFLHGAQAFAEHRPVHSFPIFSGIRVGSDLNISRLLFSDMTLHAHERLRLGWFTGYGGFQYSDAMRQVTQAVIDRGGYSKVIFIGGSGGGHASLRVSWDFPGSMAFVWNPQVDIGRYWPSYVTDYTKSCFGMKNFYDIPEDVRRYYKMNVADIYRAKGDQKNFVLYMQNISDKFHVDNHAQEFAAVYAAGSPEPGSNRLSDRTEMFLGDWGKGHVGPDNAQFVEMLERIIHGPSDFAELYRDGNWTAELARLVGGPFKGQGQEAAP
ncbi:hypothetical protein ACVFYP_06895 [Roseomonas sp. F4]